MTPRHSLRALLGIVALLSIAACSNSSAGDAGADVPVVPFSCGATQDCVSAGLDADTCLYPATANGCATTGECQQLATPSDTTNCSKAMAACTCSGGTQTIPACWQGFSPFAVQSLGPCPVDAGLDSAP